MFYEERDGGHLQEYLKLMAQGGKLATFSLKVINYISKQKITLKNEIYNGKQKQQNN